MMSRLEKLKTMLAARTDAEGKAIQGYAQNVADIRKEIERLEPAQRS
jgi:hypothetical protein